MAEKRKPAKNELLSVVVNFESLRFMTLIEENSLISNLMAEVEKTFTKLCSKRVTIKTLKNSVNAVLPEWYPVAPLIKNGDEIFAFSDTAADVFNINVPVSANPRLPAYAKSTCSSTFVYDSGFSSRKEPRTPGKNRDHQGTLGTKMNAEAKAGSPLLAKKGEHPGILSQEEYEDMSPSEVFSLPDRRVNTAVEDNKNTAKQMDGNARDDSRNSGNTEESTAVENNVTEIKQFEKVQKCKKLSTLEKEEEGENNLQSLEPPKQDTSTNKKQVKANGKSAVSRKRKDSTSSSDSNCSDESSWSSEGASTDEKEKAKTHFAEKFISRGESGKRETTSSTSKTFLKASRNKQDSSESSGDDEKEIAVDLKNLNTTSTNANKAKTEKESERKAYIVDSNNTVNRTQDGSGNKGLLGKNMQKQPGSKVKREENSSSSSSSSDAENLEVTGTSMAGNYKLRGENKSKSNDVADESSNVLASSKKAQSHIYKHGLNKTLQSDSRKPRGDGKKPGDVSMNIPRDTEESVSRPTRNTSRTKDSKTKYSETESDDASSWTGSSVEDNVGNTKQTGANNEADVGNRSQTKKPLTTVGKPAGEVDSSDDEGSNSSSLSAEKPFTQLPKHSTVAKTKKPLTESSVVLGKREQESKKSGMADDSDDSSDERPLTQLTKKAKPTMTKKPLAESPGKSNNRKGNTKATEVEVDSDEESEKSLGGRSTSLASEKHVTPPPAKNSGKLKDTVNNPMDPVPPRRSTRLNDSRDPNVSPFPPQSPVTPPSRRTAFDKSTSKVASWLLANDVTGGASDADNLDTHGKSKTTSQAQKAKNKWENKARRNETSNEENIPEDEKDSNGVTADEGVDGKENSKKLKAAKTAGQSQKRKLEKNSVNGREVISTASKNAKKKKRNKKTVKEKNTGQIHGTDLDKETTETDETDVNRMSQQQEVETSKRKATPLILPKKSKGLSALVEDDFDDFSNSQPSKKPKSTPMWSARPKPLGFLTPARSMERKKEMRGSKQRAKKATSSQPTRTTELNEKEREYLNCGELKFDTLFNDESVKWQ